MDKSNPTPRTTHINNRPTAVRQGKISRWMTEVTKKARNNLSWEHLYPHRCPYHLSVIIASYRSEAAVKNQEGS
jgi:hypothetical protein